MTLYGMINLKDPKLGCMNDIEATLLKPTCVLPDSTLVASQLWIG
jgi:hypothetical protein